MKRESGWGPATLGDIVSRSTRKAKLDSLPAQNVLVSDDAMKVCVLLLNINRVSVDIY